MEDETLHLLQVQLDIIQALVDIFTKMQEGQEITQEELDFLQKLEQRRLDNTETNTSI